MLKLGKLPVRHDRRTLQLAKYLDLKALPPIPGKCDWTTKGNPDWGIMQNDAIGDCAFAATGHAVQLWTANAAKEITIPDKAIVKAYSAVTGYTPKDPSTDQGANMLDVLNYWRKTGIGGHKINVYVQVDPTNAAHVRAAAYLFGGIYTGLALPLSAQSQGGWEVPHGGAKGKGAPGSWGGHAVWTGTYWSSGLDCVTWGKLQGMSWQFWAAYCDECYAVLSLDWAKVGTQSPNGFDWSALQADLQAVA